MYDYHTYGSYVQHPFEPQRKVSVCLTQGAAMQAVPTISLSLTQVKMIADNDRFKPIFSNRRIGAAKEINTTANKKTAKIQSSYLKC
jgi:hypothetical protein